LGARFFIIQISALILFQSANFVIIQFFGPAEVTKFNIAYKYFSALHMVFTIVMGPYWSAFTEAWVKQDFAWIRRTIRNLTRLWGLFVIMGILMLLVANLFFEVWIGKESMKNIHIGMNLQIALVVNFLLFSFGGIYTMFINGVGKITMQLISLALGAMLFVPMCYVFVKVLGWGVESVIIASILSNFYSFVVAPIQYNRIISGRAYGIWNS
jgi:O-antigen/teichoic acid export membrane protein